MLRSFQDDATVREGNKAVPMQVEEQQSKASSSAPSEANMNTRPKILIVLSMSSLSDVEANLQQLMARKEAFEACTFIIEFPPDKALPSWLEEYGADYIDGRKEKDMWKRIMGSLFGIYTPHNIGHIIIIKVKLQQLRNWRYIQVPPPLRVTPMIAGRNKWVSLYTS